MRSLCESCLLLKHDSNQLSEHFLDHHHQPNPHKTRPWLVPVRPYFKLLRFRMLLWLGLQRYCGPDDGSRQVREHVSQLLPTSSAMCQQHKCERLQHWVWRVLLLWTLHAHVLRNPRLLPRSQYVLHWEEYCCRSRGLWSQSSLSELCFSHLHNPKHFCQRVLQDIGCLASCETN